MHTGPRHPVPAHRGHLLDQSPGRSTMLVSRVRLVVRAPIVRCVVLHVLIYITVFPPRQMNPTRRLFCPVFSPLACTLKAPFDQTKLMKTWPSHAPACMCLL